MKIDIKTLKELRETKLNIDCPKLKNLPETIDPFEYYPHIDKKLNTKWSKVDEQIEWLVNFERIRIGCSSETTNEAIQKRIKQLKGE